MGRIHVRRAAPAVLASLVLGVGLAACGDDDEESEGGDAAATTEEATTTEESASEVTLTATEYEFDLSATPTAETQTLTATNDGEEFHVVVFAKINEGFTVDEAFELEGKKGSAEEVYKALELPPGETVTGEIEEPLEPGSYALLCPIGGPDGPHYKLGQLEEFEVE